MRLIDDYPHFLEGEFGYWSNILLDAQIGQAGTAGILVFAALTVLIIAYNIDFKLPKSKKTICCRWMIWRSCRWNPEPVEILPEEPSLPVEWPRNTATVHANKVKTGRSAKPGIS